MSRHPFLQIDAFTDVPLGGNPCALVLDADGLSDETMLAVAREMNLSETSFVLSPRETDVRARYFTPMGEIPMAGHPTVATIFGLVDAGRLEVGEGRSELTLELPAGVLPIEIDVRDGRVVQVAMFQQKPGFSAGPAPPELCSAFGLAPEHLADGPPAEVVDMGTPQLVVPLADRDALRRVVPDGVAHEALARAHGFFSTHLFVREGVAGGDTFARHFAPGPRGFEDPFTGSATGGMAAWLWRHGRFPEPRFVAEQGHWMDRPGRAEVEVLGPPEAIEAVRVAGAAVTVVRGELDLAGL